MPERAVGRMSPAARSTSYVGDQRQTGLGREDRLRWARLGVKQSFLELPERTLRYSPVSAVMMVLVIHRSRYCVGLAQHPQLLLRSHDAV